MKKLLSVALVIMLVASVFAGCSKPQVATEGIVKIGLGHVTSIASSKSLDGEQLPVGQVDTTMVVVALDKDNKVVKVKIDTAQTKVNFDADLKLTSNPADEYKTKVELGDTYGMKGRSGIGKEWYEQIAELEKWMVGKTIDEIKNMKTKERDASHPAVPDVAELTSKVTITVQDYINAVVEAAENAVAVQPGAEKVGLGQNISIASSKGKDGDQLPVAQVDTVMAGVAFDKDGKIVGVVIDTAQTKVNFDADGKVTSNFNEPILTKKERGNDYGMKSRSGIGKEWFEQIAELEKWMVGKTAQEVQNMKTKEKDASHPAVPDVAELTSKVTITVQDYIEAVVEANQNAK
ncbi:MAG TPA: hypothetical protein PK830_07740 [Candidatus Atribacteria bacterium]|nr:hypothetical protein [Candidatus Atribacteria bacterium]HPT78977.1 hypothetical protein [Candidatus Atribacteria bacterium]